MIDPIEFLIFNEAVSLLNFSTAKLYDCFHKLFNIRATLFVWIFYVHILHFAYDFFHLANVSHLYILFILALSLNSDVAEGAQGLCPLFDYSVPCVCLTIILSKFWVYCNLLSLPKISPG